VARAAEAGVALAVAAAAAVAALVGVVVEEQMEARRIRSETV
jgi:hypothetical protein